MESFCESYRFKSLIKDPTCFKNPENPSCINLILTNSPDINSPNRDWPIRFSYDDSFSYENYFSKIET